jgi:hypothetical protein
MKFDCGNCGQIDHVIIDGYNYGDRLLEGVTFEVRRDDDGKFHSQVEEFSREYFSQFNQERYLNMINEGMEHEEFAICPTCGEEVVINKIEIKMSSFAEILGTMAHTSVAEDVGDFTSGNDQPAEEEKEESTSTEGGDSGGGGASEDLDPAPDPESEPDTSSDSDSSSDDSSSSDSSSSDSSSGD